jgi:hypothetical protein
VSVGSRLFTAIGVLLTCAGVAGWMENVPVSVLAVLSIVAALNAACAAVAAFHGSRDPVGVDRHEGDVEASLRAPVSVPAATVATAAAASTVGAATGQPWLTVAGTIVAAAALAALVHRARARRPGG